MTATAHIDSDAYSVYSYDTGSQCEGAPTEDLVRASLAAGDTGAVHARYDSEAAEWDYVRADDVERCERRGDHVRVVYVMED